jgi:hypothetical protein
MVRLFAEPVFQESFYDGEMSLRENEKEKKILFILEI